MKQIPVGTRDKYSYLELTKGIAQNSGGFSFITPPPDIVIPTQVFDILIHEIFIDKQTQDTLETNILLANIVVTKGLEEATEHN